MDGVGPMYVCRNCHALFDEPACRVEEEVHTQLDDKPVEYLYYDVCPECGGEDFGDAPVCDYCEGEYYEEDMIGGTLCKDCLREIIRCEPDMVRAYIMDDPEAFAEYVHENKEKLK